MFSSVCNACCESLIFSLLVLAGVLWYSSIGDARRKHKNHCRHRKNSLCICTPAMERADKIKCVVEGMLVGGMLLGAAGQSAPASHLSIHAAQGKFQIKLADPLPK